MNRLKLWLYMIVVLGVGAANVYLVTQELAVRALVEVDAGLQSGVASLRVQEQLMSGRVGPLASLAVRDDGLLEAISAAPKAEGDARKKGKAPAAEGEGEERTRKAVIEAAADAAVQKAAAELGVVPPKYAVSAASAEWLARKAPAEAEADQVAASWLRDAAGGSVRRGYARFNDVVWYGAAVPAGAGGALVLFFPIDAAWAGDLQQASGCDVTIDAGTPQLITTLRPEQARSIAAAAGAAPGRPVGEGRLPSFRLESPLRATVPLLFAKAPAVRALAVELTDLKRGVVVLSRSTVGVLTPLVRYQWFALSVLVALLVVGLLLGVLVRTEVLPQVPASLVSAADKIGRGDFASRAPTFAGALGTIATALNKAAEVAQQAGEPPGTHDPFMGPPPAAQVGPSDFTFPPEPEPAAAPTPRPMAPPEPRPPAARVEAAARLSGTAFEAAPVPRAHPPEPAAGTAFGAETFSARPSPRSTTVQVTTAGATAFNLPTAPGAAAPGPEEDEEAHWRAVHAEFLETRGRCGEPTDGLGFERFRPKLQKNKDALLQKYGCRTVRFQVYVKDGKAALKATPVK